MMTNRALHRDVYAKIRGILSRATRENRGKFAMDCEIAATKLGNCARKNRISGSCDKIATKCKCRLTKELGVTMSDQMMKCTATKFKPAACATGRRGASLRRLAFFSFPMPVPTCDFGGLNYSKAYKKWPRHNTLCECRRFFSGLPAEGGLLKNKFENLNLNNELCELQLSEPDT